MLGLIIAVLNIISAITTHISNDKATFSGLLVLEVKSKLSTTEMYVILKLKAHTQLRQV